MAADCFTDYRKPERIEHSVEELVAKAEHLEKGLNPQFVVTSLSAERCEARRLYEHLYCARLQHVPVRG